jgi:DNA-binding response OmpR family regulator
MKLRTHFPVIPIEDVPVYGSLPASDARCAAILVVDDERLIADTLVQIFNQRGYCAIPAYSGAMALELADSYRPDLLISDVMMPEMTGVELAISMQEFCPDCKVILFSGQASTVDLLASARAAGHSFQTLTKPVHPDVMLGWVSELLPGREAAQLN